MAELACKSCILSNKSFACDFCPAAITIFTFGYNIALVTAKIAVKKDFSYVIVKAFYPLLLKIHILFSSAYISIYDLKRLDVGDSWRYFCFHNAQSLCSTRNCDTTPLDIRNLTLHRFSPITTYNFL